METIFKKREMDEDLLKQQNAFFNAQKTKDVSYRKEMLLALRNEIEINEEAICDAIYEDFKKPQFESMATETQLVLAELNLMIKRIRQWASPTRVSTNLLNFPSSDRIYKEPFGKVLIIAPWNYPFQLAIAPLIGAVAAGNTAVIKPSELTPNTSAIIAKIIKAVFPVEYVSVVEGGVEVSQKLLSFKWDYIFFTGSTTVGKIVYKSAAEHLTPVTLELGGKNPCIVDETAKINLAAKRIVWGKFINAGQTCIAPDYILVHHKVKDQLLEALKRNIEKSYGKNVEASPDFARIVNHKHYKRLISLLEDENVVFGGLTNESDNYLAPTLVNEPDLEAAIMKEEIFGPILPILSYKNEDDLTKIMGKYSKPLATYVFSTKRKFQKKIVHLNSFGGGAINDTIIHIANKDLPFGGVGDSGIGAYHGKLSFDLFSHHKSVLKKANWIDVPLRYPPYKLPLKLAKKIKWMF
ncbi:aldehyde dehydrogenase (NAD+) [Zhouia amylolytica]|uniref:Aldehyde dehydrogenase n=1 Tax=Zhouia amylolytica TaxID=376730 RepID=A0A1I6S5C0_9FLAO|nr:aldehyde dehydrogenase (NAD+) [Zhouia amylolytica]